MTSFAPVAGTRLGRIDGIADGSAREFVFGAGRQAFSMLVVRANDRVGAYVNLCPHVALPLTYRSPSVVSEDGMRLRCSNHAAEFALDDGCALSGPVPPGSTLEAVPIHVDEHGAILVGPAAEE